MVQVINDYGFASKFSCYVADNAANNNRETMAELSTLLGQDLDEQHRIRCAGHTIQLVVKAVIYGKGVSKFEQQLARAAPQEQFELY
jgi:hypothetical protein